MRTFSVLLAAFLIVVAAGCSDRVRRPKDPWTSRCDPSKLKGANEYDVIIAGGGFGGLSCGALLATHGYKVLLLEKNEKVGGLCLGDEKDGFHFNYGAEDIGGLWERGAITYLLNELRLAQTTLFSPNSRRFFVENTFLDVGIPPDCIESGLVEQFPESAAQIHDFLAAAKEVYLQAYDEEMVARWGIVLPTNQWTSKMPASWLRDYDKEHKQLLSWGSKSFQEVLDAYFQDQQIKNIFCGLIGYFGTLPYKTPASEIVVKTFGYFFFGGYRAIGTPQRFANILASRIEENNGTVLCKKSVSKILVGKNGVQGVQSGSHTFTAPVVISNINAKTLYTDLVDATYLPPGFVEDIRGLPMGGSAIALHLGVNEDLSSYPSLIQDRDNQTFISIISNQDPSVAPKGKSSVIVRESARYADFFRADADYVHKREQDLLSRGIDLVPELGTAVVVSRLVTPIDYEELVSVPLGSVYGFDPSSVTRLPSFRSPIPGLYLSGATSEGPGLESVIHNGILCFHDIVGWVNEPTPKEG